MLGLAQDVAQYLAHHRGADFDQHRIGAVLAPFVTGVVGQLTCQGRVDLLGDAGRQRLAAREVLGDAWWQSLGRGRALVAAQDALDIAEVIVVVVAVIALAALVLLASAIVVLRRIVR